MNAIIFVHSPQQQLAIPGIGYNVSYLSDLIPVVFITDVSTDYSLIRYLVTSYTRLWLQHQQLIECRRYDKEQDRIATSSPEVYIPKVRIQTIKYFYKQTQYFNAFSII